MFRLVSLCLLHESGLPGYPDLNCSGLQPRAVQGMLDFDFICKRKTPSVAGIIYTFGGQFVSKMYADRILVLSWTEMLTNGLQVLGN